MGRRPCLKTRLLASCLLLAALFGPAQAKEAPGADRKTWWSLQPLADVEPPAAVDAPEDWRENPIDRFLYTGMQAAGLEPAPPAERRTLLRRLSYDLTGLPPTPGEIERFAQDDSPDAYERQVDRLLASPHHGERWGRHWLDVIRFGESRGYERNQIITNLWPFRDYVIRSFNADKPFEELILEHIAGDVLAPEDPEVEIGAAFLVCGPYDDVTNRDPAQAAQIRANTLDEIIRTTGETFLGLTIGCARCHHHKFDPISQKDYYGWYATFASIFHGSRVVAPAEEKKRHAEARQPLEARKQRLEAERQALEEAIFKRAEARSREIESGWSRPPISRQRTEERFQPIRARHVRLIVERSDDPRHSNTGYRIDEFEVWTAGEPSTNVALARNGGSAAGLSRIPQDFADAYSPSLTIDGEFTSRWVAAGPELTITLAHPQMIERVVFSSDRPGVAGSLVDAVFISEYRLETSDNGESWTEVARSHDREPLNDAHRRKRFVDQESTAEEVRRIKELDSEVTRTAEQLDAIPGLPSWWVGNTRKLSETFHVFEGGNPQRKGATVLPASLSALADVAPRYALTGAAPEGERRQELAQWIASSENPLTARVIANRLWHYHFGVGIVDTPSDFGYMGGQPSHPELLDWLARELHHHAWRLKPLHRLIVTSAAYRQSSEYRQDAARKDASSRLLWRFPPRRLSAEEIRDTILTLTGQLDTHMGGPGFRLYRYIQDNVATYVPLDTHGPGTWRRSVYHHNARAAIVDMLTDFDCPDNAFATPRRSSTTTPLQALTLLNHSFTLDMSRELCARLRRDAGADSNQQVLRAFELAYSRRPSGEELAATTELIQAHGLRAFCRVLLNSSELIFLQ